MENKIILQKNKGEYEIREPAFSGNVLYAKYYSISASKRYVLVRESFTTNCIFCGEKKELLESMIFGTAGNPQEVQMKLFSRALKEVESLCQIRRARLTINQQI